MRLSESSRRVDARSSGAENDLAELGLTQESLWFSAATLFGGAGVMVLVVRMISPEVIPLSILALGVFSCLVALGCFLGGRYLGDSVKYVHARGAIAFLIYGWAVAVSGDYLVAFGLMPLLGGATSLYIYRLRTAAPYAIIAVSLSIYACLNMDVTSKAAQAVVTPFAFVMVALLLLMTKRDTRRIAHQSYVQAHSDPLTGIANMRQLREALTSLSSASESSSPSALFAMDLDNFKSVNDEFDHSMGDRVLRAVARAIAAVADDADLPVRRGGDEFSLLVPDAAARDLEALRRELERSIERGRRAVCPQITPTASVAYVVFEPGEELGALMSRADDALHEAKLKSRELQAGAARNAEVASLSERIEIRAQEESMTDAVAAARQRPPGATLWWVVAALLGSTGAVVTSLSIAGLVAGLSSEVGFAIGAALLCLGATCVVAGFKGVSRSWLHLPWILGLGLTATLVSLAGQGGGALLDLLALFALFGLFVFRVRAGVFYAVAALAAYGTLAAVGDLAGGTGRTAVTTLVLAIVGGLIVRLRAISVHAARANRVLSEVDPLTGLANRRALEIRLTDAVERASTGGRRPVVVQLDLDDFKGVNDRHSHTLGDQVLCAVARSLEVSARENDLVARRGGDEFVVVMDDVDLDAVPEIVLRMGEAITSVRQRICPDVAPTATASWVPWTRGQDAEILLRNVDEELHDLKVRSRVGRRLSVA